MKINCTQCGARHTVTKRDYFLRCPYCDSRLIINPPENTPALVIPAISEEDALRLFPPGMALSIAIKYFPYFDSAETPADHHLRPCFNQPWQELEIYSPPDGDRRIFDQDMGEPDDFIPFDRDEMDDEPGRIVFHPFYVVMLKLDGYNEGLLVDAVSGRLMGDSPLVYDSTGGEGSLHRLFLITLLIALAVSIPAFFIFRSIGISWINSTWLQLIFFTVLAVGVIYLRR